MSVTRNEIVRRALVQIDVIGSIEALPAEMAVDDGAILNDLIDSLALESLAVPFTRREEFTLVANDGEYTIGTGGQLATARPDRIDRAGVIPLATTVELPLRQQNEGDYAEVRIKTLTSTFPTEFNYAAEYPLGVITLWPIPTTAATLVLYMPSPVAQFADGTTSYDLPPGYQRAFIYNLAIELAVKYGKDVSQGLAMLAAESKGTIKRANVDQETMGVDPYLMGDSGYFNYRTGE